MWLILYFYETALFFSLYLEGRVYGCSTLLNITKLFAKGITPLPFPPSSIYRPRSPRCTERVRPEIPQALQWSLLMCRDEIGFFMQILYSANLLSLLVLTVLGGLFTCLLFLLVTSIQIFYFFLVQPWQVVFYPLL